MKIEPSMQDVREPSEELAQKEMEEFAGNISKSQLCHPVDPVVPAGEWKHCQVSHRVKAHRNTLGISVSLWFRLSEVFAVLSLQRSLNVDQGLGLATLFSAMPFQTIITIAFPMLPSLLRFKCTVLTD